MAIGKWCGKTAWLPMGVGAGTALGVACGNLALWLAIGIAFGAAMQARHRHGD